MSPLKAKAEALAVAKALRDPDTGAVAIAVLLEAGAGNLAAEITAWKDWASFSAAGVTFRWAIKGLTERAQDLHGHRLKIARALLDVGAIKQAREITDTIETLYEATLQP